MPFQVFCVEHFDEALKHITEKYPDHDVGYCDAFSPDQFESHEDLILSEYICDYPNCDNYPDKEIIWMEQFTEDDLKTSKYRKLEDLK